MFIFHCNRPVCGRILCKKYWGVYFFWIISRVVGFFILFSSTHHTCRIITCALRIYFNAAIYYNIVFFSSTTTIVDVVILHTSWITAYLYAPFWARWPWTSPGTHDAPSTVSYRGQLGPSEWKSSINLWWLLSFFSNWTFLDESSFCGHNSQSVAMLFVCLLHTQPL